MTIERVSTMRNLLLPKNTTDENAHLLKYVCACDDGARESLFDEIIHVG